MSAGTRVISKYVNVKKSLLWLARDRDLTLNCTKRLIIQLSLLAFESLPYVHMHITPACMNINSFHHLLAYVEEDDV